MPTYVPTILVCHKIEKQDIYKIVLAASVGL